MATVPTKKIAALYVEENGVYSGVDFIDFWPKSRDARNYKGPLPVIAHPPCQLWGNLAAVNFARWGGEHNRPGNDGGCFLSALESVRKFCGVLEHPKNSRAFKHYGIPTPSGAGWVNIGNYEWVCEVWQSAYGHRAAKATWLFYRGECKPFDLSWQRVPGTHQIGFYDKRGKDRNKKTLNKKEANATPIKFRDELINLALLSTAQQS